MKSPRSRSIQVELGEGEGFWSVLQLLQQEPDQVFECWAASWKTENQLRHVSNDVILSDWVRTIRSACTINSFMTEHFDMSYILCWKEQKTECLK